MYNKFFEHRIIKVIVPVFVIFLISVSFQACHEDEILQNDNSETEAILPLQLKSATFSAGDIDALIVKIENYLSEGDLESGLANAFTVKLENAKKSLEKENEKASVNQLQALINQLKELTSDGAIETSIGKGLIYELRLLAGETPIFTDPRDNHEYKTIKIGDQVWMAENLAYLPKLTFYFGRSFTDPCYYVYDFYTTNVLDAKATANYKTYGVLYNWPAAKSACPEGWHLPTNAEWDQLAGYLIDNGYGYSGDGDDIAKALAATSGWYWDEWDCGEGTPANDILSNNSSGFSGLPGGCNITTSARNFDNMEKLGVWWSATEGENSTACFWSLYYRETQLNKYCNQDLYMGYSVRCLRD